MNLCDGLGVSDRYFEESRRLVPLFWTGVVFLRNGPGVFTPLLLVMRWGGREAKEVEAQEESGDA